MGTNMQAMPAFEHQDNSDYYKFSIRSQLVEIYCTVTENDRLVPNLKLSDFRLAEDGMPVYIDRIDNPDVPLQIVLMLDVSESIKESLNTVQAAATVFLESLNPEDRVVLILFNSAIHAFPQTTDDRELIFKEIKNAQARGGTKLYEALLLGMQYLASKPGRKAIVCFTDGQDTSSKSSRTDALDAAAQLGYPIYVIGAGAALKLTTSKMILNQFAEINSGKAFFIESLKKLREAFAEVAMELRSAYVLSYYTRIVPDGQWHDVSIHTTNAGHIVNARKGFFATIDTSP